MADTYKTGDTRPEPVTFGGAASTNACTTSSTDARRRRADLVPAHGLPAVRMLHPMTAVGGDCDDMRFTG